MPEAVLQGSVRVLVLFDICEEIRLEQLRSISGGRVAERAFKGPAPDYVRFQRPPVVEPIGSLILDSGEKLEGQIKYYDYGVLSTIFELPFCGDWGDLIKLASRWMWDTPFESQVTALAKQKLEPVASALVKPYSQWLSEDYFIFHLREVAGVTSAADLLAQHGGLIAQIVRGETSPLSESERNEVLQSRLSYYPNDLAVIGWNGAVLYDTPAGAESAIPLLEYANSQLLEFRHYDELLSRELEGVYRTLDGTTTALHRWRIAREASRLHTVLLDITELTERADNAIKFLSDMFSARLYRLAAQKVGVPDYKNLVGQKMKTAEDLYDSMVEQFHQSRAFVLELMIVIILIIDLFFLFRGKT